MVVPGNYSTGDPDNVGAKGTPVTSVNRLAANGIDIPLAQYRSLRLWTPRVTDKIIWHGWFTRWYGVVSEIDRDTLYVIKEGLPVLLFTMLASEYRKNTVVIPVAKIMRSRGGEFTIIQGEVWYIDE